MKTAVQFGAGAIGRGLMGDILYESGYRIVFIDTDDKLIQQINETHSFDLIETEKNNHRKTITKVDAINARKQENQAIAELCNASVITTSVRVENLKYIAPVIAKGLIARKQLGVCPVDIMAFENSYKASDTLKQLVLDADEGMSVELLKETARFANTVTDRGVMLIEENGKSVVQIGNEFEAAIEQSALYDPNSKPIKDGSYTKNIDFFIDRKMFIENGGHCTCGYLARLKGYTYIMEGFQDEDLYKKVRDEMREVAYMLSKKYELPLDELEDYVEYTLGRYLGSKYSDPLTRVCRSPIRKLGPSDRFTAPALQAEQLGTPTDCMARSIAATLLFVNEEDEEAVRLQKYIQENGIEKSITEFTTVLPETGLYHKIMESYEKFKKEAEEK